MLKFILLFNATGEDIPPMQLKEGVFRCILQLYDCLLTEVHERWKKWPNLAKRLNSSLAFFCYDLLSIIEPRQVFELVFLTLIWFFWTFYLSHMFYVIRQYFVLRCSCQKVFVILLRQVHLSRTRDVEIKILYPEYIRGKHYPNIPL